MIYDPDSARRIPAAHQPPSRWVAAMETAGAETVQISVPLPRSPDTRIYIRLTIQSKAILVFLTTASAGEAATATPLGSFVYALPDVCAPLLSIARPSTAPWQCS